MEWPCPIGFAWRGVGETLSVALRIADRVWIVFCARLEVIEAERFVEATLVVGVTGRSHGLLLHLPRHGGGVGFVNRGHVVCRSTGLFGAHLSREVLLCLLRLDLQTVLRLVLLENAAFGQPD